MLFSFIGISVSVEGSRYDEKKTGLKNSQIVPGKFIVEFHPGNSDGHNVCWGFTNLNSCVNENLWAL